MVGNFMAVFLSSVLSSEFQSICCLESNGPHVLFFTSCKPCDLSRYPQFLDKEGCGLFWNLKRSSPRTGGKSSSTAVEVEWELRCSPSWVSELVYSTADSTCSAASSLSTSAKSASVSSGKGKKESVVGFFTGQSSCLRKASSERAVLR